MENQNDVYLAADPDSSHNEETESGIFETSDATSNICDEDIEGNDIIEDINRIQQALYSLSNIDTADDFNQLFETICTYS